MLDSMCPHEEIGDRSASRTSRPSFEVRVHAPRAHGRLFPYRIEPNPSIVHPGGRIEIFGETPRELGEDNIADDELTGRTALVECPRGLPRANRILQAEIDQDVRVDCGYHLRLLRRGVFAVNFS